MTTSAKIVNHLRAITDKAQTFTAETLIADLGLGSRGAVTGTLSRLRDAQCIAVIDAVRGPDSTRKAAVYQIADEAALAAFTVRDGEYAPPVRTTSSGGTTAREQIIKGLLTIASRLETMKGGLEDYSTEELLKEIQRRVRRGE